MWKHTVTRVAVQTYTSKQRLFITELAPWMGGFYERLAYGNIYIGKARKNIDPSAN